MTRFLWGVFSIGVVALVVAPVLAGSPGNTEWRLEEWMADDEEVRSVYRIKGGCRTKKGAIVVLDMPNEQKKRFSSDGFGKHVSFVKELPTGLEKINTDFLYSGKAGEIVPRENAKEFVKDVIPIAMAIEAVLGDPAGRNIHTGYSCEGFGCEESQKERLNMLLMVPNALEEDIRTKVNYTVVGPVLSSLSTRVTMIGKDKLLKHNEEGFCFNSVVLWSNRFPETLNDVFFSDHFLWRNMGVSRDPKDPASRFIETKEKQVSCEVKIELVSARKTNSISNAYIIRDSIIDALKGTKITPKVSIEYYERSRANYQIFRANDADILITPFRPTEANLFFMRRGTHVIELYSVGVCSAHFEHLAKALGIRMVAFAGKALPEAFKICIDQMNGKPSLDELNWYNQAAANITRLGPGTKAESCPLNAVRSCVDKLDIIADVQQVTDHVLKAARMTCI